MTPNFAHTFPWTWLRYLQEICLKAQNLAENHEFSLLKWGFHNFLEMENLMVLMVNLLEANPKHVSKTSWKEHLRNFSSKNSKNFTKKGLEKRCLGVWNNRDRC